MISLSELKAWLGITGSASDAVLLQLEAAAVEYLQNWLDRYFGPPKEFVQIYDTRGVWTATVYLKEDPIISPAPTPPDPQLPTVIAEVWGSSWASIPASDYRMEGRILDHVGGCWPFGKRNLRFTYSAGYEPGSEPADIRQAVIDLVSLKYRTIGHEGMKSESILSYSYTRADGDAAIENATGMLNSWRNYPI